MTVNASDSTNCPFRAVSATITPNGSLGNPASLNASWTSLPAIPNDFKIYDKNNGSVVYFSTNGSVQINTTGLTNFTFTAKSCSGLAPWGTVKEDVNIVAICY